MSSISIDDKIDWRRADELFFMMKLKSLLDQAVIIYKGKQINLTDSPGNIGSIINLDEIK